MKRNLQIIFTDTAAHALTFRVRSHASRHSRTDSLSHLGYLDSIPAAGQMDTEVRGSGRAGGVTTNNVLVALGSSQTAEVELERSLSPIPSPAVPRIGGKN